MRYATTIGDHTYAIEINREGEITIDGAAVRGWTVADVSVVILQSAKDHAWPPYVFVLNVLVVTT